VPVLRHEEAARIFRPEVAEHQVDAVRFLRPADGAVHHAGDLPSLTADAQGTATIDFTSRSIALDRGTSGILGRGLIVHNDPDDYTTQPTGNSGARVACAVIERGA